MKKIERNGMVAVLMYLVMALDGALGIAGTVKHSVQ
jgi:hypothetical protein